MKKIIAIGGGEIGRPGCPVETTKIDQETIKLTGKKRPKLLFIPTASSDSESYVPVVQKHFGQRLGCQTDVLYLINQQLIKQDIADKILSADIIYVGGGNTFKMMKIWRQNNVDRILKKAYKKGIVLSGVSAGSICWFKWGSSDSRRFRNPAAASIKVSGLGLIKALHCPHYDVEKHRKADLKKVMRKTSGVAIALENCCALEVIDDQYRIISSKASANVYKVYWQGSKYHEEKIKKEKKFKPLVELLKK